MKINLEFFKNLNINISTVRKMTGLIACLLVCVIIVSYDFMHLSIVSIGEVVPVDIKAPKNQRFIDESIHQRMKDEEVSKVEKVYVIDKKITQQVLKNLTEFYTLLENRQIDSIKDEREKSLANDFMKISPYKVAKITVVIDDLARKILEPDGYRKEEKNNIFKAIKNKIEEYDILTQEEKILMYKTLDYFLRPNLKYDEEKTQLLRKEAAESIRPVERYIKKGEIIVREGDKLDKSSFNLLKSIGYFDSRITFVQNFIGYFLLFIFFTLILYFYLHHFNSDILAEEPLVYFIELIVFLSILGFKFYNIILSHNYNIIVENNAIPLFSVYLIPLAAIAMLVTLVVDSKFAILLSSMLSVIGGLIFREMSFVVVMIIGSIVSVYTIMSAKTRAEQLLSGLYLIITNISLVVALHFINMKYMTFGQDIKFLLRDVLHGFFNGAFSIIFAMGTMPFFEKVFRVTSALKLLELTDLNNKLLKMLLEQTPGTYHHSIMVANLAEAAALDIGADSLLARIGGYYHDIGKVKRPFFFVENLMGKDNQHENLSPNLSAIIITSHVKDGVEIATKHNLPEEIIDIIRQHHGTTLVKYFYEKAKEELGDSVKENQYRYPGPKPQTREAALVMLADSVESATRSLNNPSPSSIDNLIKKITNDKFIDEQFDECNLTLKEIEKIRNVFSRVLLQMFHRRIEYPDRELGGQGVLR